ncbi:bifunctional folylpolyglutamate synthase/dihydrofolate synthase [Bacteroidota bacterium]
MDYQQALDYLYDFVNYETLPMSRDAAHFDLRRMDELMRRLGTPHQAARSVHVAGTKGKGSTAAMIASALTASGYITGLNTSPHLIDLRERIKIDGEFIAEAELVNLVEKLRTEFDTVRRQATYGELTTFEVLTALAFYYFKEKSVDFQVMEVGLGGRLDATNIINPEVGVITTIGYDHTEVLGKSLTEIAVQKAGIIKPGNVVVLSSQPDEAAKAIESVAAERDAKLVRVGRDVTWRSLDFDLFGQRFEVQGRLGDYRLSIPLLGDHQLGNAATAVAALEVLAEKGFHISGDSITKGLQEVNWPGRFQVIRRNPFIVVDGAHNLESMQRLEETLGQYFGLSAGGVESREGIPHVDQSILIFGASLDKELGSAISELHPLFDKVLVTHSRHPRAAALEAIIGEFTKQGVEPMVTADVPGALSLAESLAGDNGLICVTGSLFVVGEAIEQVEKGGG